MSARISYPDPCPETGRRVVTVAEWAARPDALIDEYAYWFSPETAEMGLDPWRLVEGVDPAAEAEKCDVLFDNGSYRTTLGDHPIYIRSRDYEVLQCGK